MIALHLALAVLASQQPTECRPAQTAQCTQPTPVVQVCTIAQVQPVVQVQAGANVQAAALTVAQGQGMAELTWKGDKSPVKAAAPKLAKPHAEPVVVPQIALEPVHPKIDLKLSAPALALRHVEPPVALELAPAAPLQHAQRRAWIGVELESDGQGNADLEIGNVIEASPAERAELQPGDRLTALDGHALSSFEDLKARLAEHHPGASVQLSVMRSADVELDQRGWGEKGKPRLGVRLSEDGGPGLLVDSVEPGWPAEAAGMRAGDRIHSIQGQDVAAASDLTEVLAEIEPGHPAELRVERQVELELGTFPEDGSEEGQAPSGGMQRFGLPEGQDDFQPWTRQDQPPQVFGLPGGGQLQVQPRFPQARAQEGTGLESELRSLRDELRSLREELRALRSELDDLRRTGSGRVGR